MSGDGLSFGVSQRPGPEQDVFDAPQESPNIGSDRWRTGGHFDGAVRRYDGELFPRGSWTGRGEGCWRGRGW